MNWLDVVLLILLLGSVVTSFSAGLTREVVGLHGPFLLTRKVSK